MLKPFLAALLLGAAAPALAGAATVPAEAARAGPALGTFGVDLSGMDRSVRPGDDFFRFVNGNIRPQTVRNHDAWYRAFQVAETDALYLPPEERVRIW
jgi:predicted metalloendopeptidase